MSVIWPEGLATCAPALRLLPDMVTYRVWSGRQERLPVYVCCGSTLIRWPAECSLAGRYDPWVRVLRLLPDTATCRVLSGWQVWPPVYMCCGSSLTQQPVECGLAGRYDSLCTCVAAPPWHSNLLSAVCPAEMTTCVRVLRVLSDTATCRVRSDQQGWPPDECCSSSLIWRLVECGLAGRNDHLCTCVMGSSLTRRPVECSLAGRDNHLCMCVAAPPNMRHAECDLPAEKTVCVHLLKSLPETSTCWV